MVKTAVLGVSKIAEWDKQQFQRKIGKRKKLNVRAGDFLQYLLTEEGQMLVRNFEYDLMLAIKNLNDAVKNKDSKIS